MTDTRVKVPKKIRKALTFKLFGKKFRVGSLAFSIFLFIVAIVIVIPIYWCFVSSIRPIAVSTTLPPRWLPPKFSEWDFTGFDLMFNSTYADFWGWAWNSIKISLIVTFFMVSHATLSGYAYAKLRFPGRSLMFSVLILGLMVPTQVTIVPMFRIYTALGVVDTHWALLLSALTGASGPGCNGVFGVFMLRQFFKTVPNELNEAALIDGASPVRTFFTIMLPIARTTIVSLLILFFTYAWNDYYMCSVLITSAEKYTLPVGVNMLKTTLVGNAGGDRLLMVYASITFAVAPLIVVFAFCQRWIVESLTKTGIKG